MGGALLAIGMKNFLYLCVSAAALISCGGPSDTALPEPVVCQIGSYDFEEISQLKQSQFENLDQAQLNQLALDMLNCLGDPDPAMRDGVVFEGLSFLLRQDKLDMDTRLEMMTRLMSVLQSSDDQDGFRKPFAALDLSEVARTDRVESYLSDGQRSALVVTATEYLTDITDYRGFDDKEGWRHGVAHGADLVLQLVLNEAVGVDELVQLRDAVSTQIVAGNGHAYIHGEPGRLARPILFMARRGVFSQENWDDWFAQLADTAPFDSWGDVFQSEAGLAKLHNTKAFLNAIYLNASETSNEQIKMLKSGALAARAQLP